MQTRVVLNKEEKEAIEKFINIYCELQRVLPSGCYLDDTEDYLDLNEFDIDIVRYIDESEFLVAYEEK